MPGTAVSSADIRDDFDRIALLPEEGWNHNNHYHPFLLKYVPQPCREALEIGCGTGAFSRLLAGRADHVTALDLSPNMIRLARERSREFDNLQFEVADATLWDIPAGRYDCIVSLATFHHLPAEEILERVKPGLAAGGRLIVLDLYRMGSLADVPVNLVAFPLNFLVRLIKSGDLDRTREARRAWQAHSRHDTYPTLAAIRKTYLPLLPGARLRRHLFWRYSLIWENK